MYKQIIIARKDLNMSPGKLSAQVAHGSMAFLTTMVRRNTQRHVKHRYLVRYPDSEEFNSGEFISYMRDDLWKWAKEADERGEEYFYAKPVNPNEPYGRLELCEPEYIYRTEFDIDNELYEQWINGEFTKCVLEAKNKNHLLKVESLAAELNLRPMRDYWMIRDNCHTELESEEDGRTLTCIAFRPMDAEIIDKIGYKYQLYR